MSVKSDFVTALRATPDAIAALLETPLPTVPEGLTVPTDEESANIMTGILSFYILQIFSTFQALTPIELALRIGQHSNPIEAICLAGLEYLEDSGANTAFDIIEPVDGKKYKQGDIRIIVKSRGKISTVDVTVDHNSIQDQVSLTPDNSGKMFYGYVRCDEIFDYTFTFSAAFNTSSDNNSPPKVDVKTATVTISITDEADGENASGTDLTAFDIAAQQVIANADGFIGEGGRSGGAGASGSWENSSLLEKSVNKLIEALNGLA
jgi:hypothetical protein